MTLAGGTLPSRTPAHSTNEKNKILTVCIGQVTDNTDDQHSGQVRVKIPSLDNTMPGDETQEQTFWARVTSLFAGGHIGDSEHSPRGTMFMPEVGDEVVVAFEHGAIEKAYILGSVFSTTAAEGSSSGNSAGKPNRPMYSHTQNKGPLGTPAGEHRNKPRPNKNDVSGLMTRLGHSIVFNDHEAGGMVTIRSSTGNVINIRDNGEGIEVADAAGNVVQIGGASGHGTAQANSITVKCKETITLDAKNIVMKASEKIKTTSSQDTEMKCSKFKLTMDSGDIVSSGALNIKGSPLNLN